MFYEDECGVVKGAFFLLRITFKVQDEIVLNM
jgi:hypothetical protein